MKILFLYKSFNITYYCSKILPFFKTPSYTSADLIQKFYNKISNPFNFQVLSQIAKRDY